MGRLHLTTTPIVDWWEGTAPLVYKSTQDLRIFAAWSTRTATSEWRSDKSFNRYELCERHVSGVQMLSGKDDMGTHIIASGSALTEWRTRGNTGEQINDQLLGEGFRPTRIDLALDVIGSKIKLDTLYKMYLAGDCETRAKDPYAVKSGANGWTMYIGAPQSDRHARIYNKEAELKKRAACPPGVKDWIRFELVTMSQDARSSGRAITEYGIPVAVRSAIRDFAFFPKSRGYVKALEGDIEPVGKSTRKVTNTRMWLLNVVAKVVAKEAYVDDDFFLDFTERVRDEMAGLTGEILESDTVLHN